MSRTTLYKILYLSTFVLLGGASAAILVVTGGHVAAFVLLMLVLLLPGRIQGHFWRDFFRGRRLLGQGRAEESIPCFMRFLEQLSARPWIRRLIWLGWGMYTRDIEVMTRTNIAVARMFIGELDEARRELLLARKLDPQSPLPWFNLGVLARARGDDDSSAEAFSRARDLGFRGGMSDRIVRGLGGALARVEGAGKGDPAGRP